MEAQEVRPVGQGHTAEKGSQPGSMDSLSGTLLLQRVQLGDPAAWGPGSRRSVRAGGVWSVQPACRQGLLLWLGGRWQPQW